MKTKWMDILLALVLGLVLPWGLCALYGKTAQKNLSEGQIQITVSEETQTVRTIQVLTEQGVQEMALSDYLTGVLLGEMPGSFALEAKKAQAVVARTYALRVAAGNRHAGAVCTDSGCCQSYRDMENMGDTEAVAQAREAVEQTEGMVLTYQGKLIDATYFSCSGGMTENAVAVWGSDIPYLQSVESPGEEYATHYIDSITFSVDEFRKALRADLPENPALWFGAVTYTQGGGVETMKIGGKTYQGTQLRKLLGLRSTAFDVTVDGHGITVTTRGFGHRGGMSQYGADAMAAAGSGFQEILHHYYQNVTLETDW